MSEQLKRCHHCGRVCGDLAGGSAAIYDTQGSHPLCHPNETGRPDCYRLVTVYGDPLGSLLPAPVLSGQPEADR